MSAYSSTALFIELVICWILWSITSIANHYKHCQYQDINGTTPEDWPKKVEKIQVIPGWFTRYLCRYRQHCHLSICSSFGWLCQKPLWMCEWGQVTVTAKRTDNETADIIFMGGCGHSSDFYPSSWLPSARVQIFCSQINQCCLYLISRSISNITFYFSSPMSGFSLKRALLRLKKAHSTNRRETVSSWVMHCNDNARTTTTDTGIASLGQHFWADNVVSKPFESFLTPSPDHSVVSPTGWLESDWSPQLVAVFTKKLFQ